MTTQLARVRCPVCLHEESWSTVHHPGVAPVAEIIVPGGDRRSSEAPPLAAWHILAKARREETGPVVARCPACGLPMIALDPGLVPLSRWELETSAGTFVVDPATWRITGPNGPIAEADLERLLLRIYPRPSRFAPADIVGGVVLFLVVSVPIAGWVFSIFYVFWFGWGFAHQAP